MTGIVVLNYNTYNATVACLDSINTLVKTDYIIYLVDNHSDQECTMKLRQKYQAYRNVVLVFLEKNLGYSGGNNEGIKRAVLDGVDDILILNSDVILLNDIVSILKKDLNETVAISGPQIYTAEKKNGQHIRKNYSFIYALTDKKPYNYLRKIVKKWDVDYNITNWEHEFEFSGMLSGCCFLIDLKVFQKIDFFDDNVFLYGEEYIIGRKLEKLKMKTFYDPQAQIIHNHGTSTSNSNGGFVDYHRYASLYYVLKNYCNPSKLELLIIKNISLVNFSIKALLIPSYKERKIQLIKKINEIDDGNNKISF